MTTSSRGAHDVQGEAEGVELIQPGEEEAEGGSNWLFKVAIVGATETRESESSQTGTVKQSQPLRQRKF